MSFEASRLGNNSPMELRNDADNNTLDTYHPRKLFRQPKISRDSDSETLKVDEAQEENQSKRPLKSSSKPRWLPRLASSGSNGNQLEAGNHRQYQNGGEKQGSKPLKSLRERLSQKIARISSLDSTRSSSSVEIDSSVDSQMISNVNGGANTRPMPTISITNDGDLRSAQAGQDQLNGSSARRRHEHYNDYYGRSRHGLAQDRKNRVSSDEESDDLPLPIPYSSSSMARSSVVRQQTSKLDGRSRELFAYLLDDRQGMNSNEGENFTKGEKAAAAAMISRPSIDGSLGGEFNRRTGAAKGKRNFSSSAKRDKQMSSRRSKSPSSLANFNLLARSSQSSSGTKQRAHRRGFLNLASKLKLTKKHESFAKLQLSILNSGFVSLKTIDKDLSSFLPKERMSPKEFEERVKLIRKYEVLARIEYKFASRYETYVCRHATQESNQVKNNYKKYIPYDYNRVVLKTLPSIPDSDYINASHVDSYLKPNAYIAAQGPNENTIEDFWRMIWEQRSFVIVMLTKVFDFIRVMCNQYWPVEVNKPERYGNLEVTLLYEEPLADFVIRTIKLTKLIGNQPAGQATEDQATKDQENGGASAGDHEGRASDSRFCFDDQQQVPEGAEFEEEDFTDDDDCEDDTSASELPDELAMSYHRASAENNLISPLVRAPKYPSKARRASPRDTNPIGVDSGGMVAPNSRANSLASNRVSASERDLSQFNLTELKDKLPPRSVSQPQADSRVQAPVSPAGGFLHPLLSGQQLATSNSSLSSAPMTPLSPPMTPRTPTSMAGLDRSSATRKAVKKKRRLRTKNTRPVRTQFQVPDEWQLIDDEDNQTAEARSADRIVYQFHYNSWASHTCPFISSLLHFRRRVRICMDEMSKSGKTGPTIVHCNDGCGRTGTYLAIDANLELAEEDNVYDVFNYTKMMRQSRKFLMENLEQYKFVYDTIEEAMFCGKTWFPVSELHKRLKHKSQRNPITKKNEYQREYEKITRMTLKFSIGDCAGGHRVENREKNRDVSTVPPDNFRPYLTSFQSNDNTDYINAVFVDGYTRSKEYIVTEWPLHKTICDFWSLVYDHDCNSVILLANPGESSTYPSFLPSEKELRRKFGPVFSAEMVSYTHYQNIKSWIYTINKKIVSLTEVIAGVKSEAKTTQVFQITCWPQGHRVPTSTNALVELMNMVERWRQRTAYGPVCVVSLNGKSRAGVYCAANVAIEQVVQHSEVDVFQAVKTVRRHRPQLIENMTEYKYCYDLILHYVLHYVNQASGNT